MGVGFFGGAGGCGSMYEIVMDSELFKGKRLIQQHRMINEVQLYIRIFIHEIKLYIYNESMISYNYILS